MPGLGLQDPLFRLVRVRDVREHTMDIHPQPVITKDNVEILVDGIMWVRPTLDEESIKRTFYNIDDSEASDHSVGDDQPAPGVRSTHSG